MNPIVAAVLEKNPNDIKAIVAKIGIDGLFELMPHITAILKTVQEAQQTK
jgi:hypothetical protein